MTPEATPWREFARRHWRALAVVVVAGLAAIAEAFLVFLWFAAGAQSSGLVPSALGLWTMGNLVTFGVEAVLWELLLVGVPVTAGGALAWRWWKRLPEEERRGLDVGKGSKPAGGGGGFSFLLFVAFCLKVYLDGKWDVAVGTFTVDYVVGSLVTILVWALVIFGIPAAVIAALWVRREIKRP